MLLIQVEGTEMVDDSGHGAYGLEIDISKQDQRISQFLKIHKGEN